jgi:hypothetical protein
MSNLIRMSRGVMAVGGLALLNLFSSCAKDSVTADNNLKKHSFVNVGPLVVPDTMISTVPTLTPEQQAQIKAEIDSMSNAGHDRPKTTYPLIRPKVQ